MFCLTFYKRYLFTRDRKDKQCSVTNPFLLNEIVISSGNENNTHFFVTYETESRALTLFHMGGGGGGEILPSFRLSSL